MTVSVEHAAWGWEGVAIALAGIGAGAGMGWRWLKRWSGGSARGRVAGGVFRRGGGGERGGGGCGGGARAGVGDSRWVVRRACFSNARAPLRVGVDGVAGGRGGCGRAGCCRARGGGGRCG